MSVLFVVPGPLRAFTNGRDRVSVSGTFATVRHALAALWAMHPGLRDRIVNEQGAVREHVNLFVGNENIRDAQGLDTPLREGAEISIVPAISGG